MNPNCLQKHNNVKKVFVYMQQYFEKKNDSPCVFPRVTEINFFLLGWSEINLFFIKYLVPRFLLFSPSITFAQNSFENYCRCLTYYLCLIRFKNFKVDLQKTKEKN